MSILDRLLDELDIEKKEKDRKPTPQREVGEVASLPEPRVGSHRVEPEPSRTETPKPKVEVTAQLPVEEEVHIFPKDVFVIYGDKGVGKTYTAMSFPGEIVCLSFDRKSDRIKAYYYSGDSRIHIYDVTKFMDYSSPEVALETAVKVYDYVLAVLRYWEQKGGTDWVLIDGAGNFSQICEFVMRQRHGLEAFQGVSNLNVWKERRMLIRQVHNMALNIARKGIIYTTYQEKDEIVIEGEIVTKKDVPKWIDVIMYETDIVLHCYYDPTSHGFYVKVVTSKNPKFPTGKVYDVTEKKFWEVAVGGVKV